MSYITLQVTATITVEDDSFESLNEAMQGSFTLIEEGLNIDASNVSVDSVELVTLVNWEIIQ